MYSIAERTQRAADINLSSALKWRKQDVEVASQKAKDKCVNKKDKSINLEVLDDKQRQYHWCKKIGCSLRNRQRKVWSL